MGPQDTFHDHLGRTARFHDLACCDIQRHAAGNRDVAEQAINDSWIIPVPTGLQRPTQDLNSIGAVVVKVMFSRIRIGREVHANRAQPVTFEVHVVDDRVAVNNLQPVITADQRAVWSSDKSPPLTDGAIVGTRRNRVRHSGLQSHRAWPFRRKRCSIRSQSDFTPTLGPELSVSPPAESSRYDVKIAQLPGVPCGLQRPCHDQLGRAAGLHDLSRLPTSSVTPVGMVMSPSKR